MKSVKKSAANIRMALMIGCVALGVFAFFIWFTVNYAQ